MGRWKNKDILPPEVFPTPPYNAGVALKKNSLGQCLRDARRCHGLTLVDLSNLLMEYGVQISGAALFPMPINCWLCAVFWIWKTS